MLRAVTLTTPRLVLEPLEVDHASAMAGVLASPQLYEFTGGAPPTTAELEERYARLVVGHSPDGTQVWMNWVVVSSRPVGYVQATLPRRDTAAPAELAWVLQPGSQGRGYASEAVRAVQRWLSDRGVPGSTACIHPEHRASERVAARTGMSATPDVTDEGERVWTTAHAVPAAD